MCDDGDHEWAHNLCMICPFCGYCTGYGPGCCNEGLPGREAGKYANRYCMCDSVLNMKVELPSKFLDTLNITRKITLTHKYSEFREPSSVNG